MKSFRLYKPTPPERLVSDYSPEERARFREQFRQVAEWQRRGAWTGGGILALGFLCGVLAQHFTSGVRFWLACACLISWLVVLVIGWSAPSLDCPACHNRLDIGLGAYCPECGAPALHPPALFMAAHCTACDRTISGGRRRRSYMIRTCSHCGVGLDEQGG